MLSPEKKTEMISIKLATSQLNQLRELAEMDGIGLAEMVRDLIDREVEARRIQYAALHSIFGEIPQKTRNDLE
jgi:hypothetical protein